MLHNNVTICRQAFKKPPLEAQVQVFCGDCIELCPALEQDILILDPPWGGKAYKDKELVPLFLSGLSMGTVVRGLVPFCKYVALKLPLNADVEGRMDVECFIFTTR